MSTVVDEIKIMQILDRVCIAAKKFGVEDDNLRVETVNLVTEQLTAGLDDKSKILPIRCVVDALYIVVAGATGWLARFKRMGYQGEAIGLIAEILRE